MSSNWVKLALAFMALGATAFAYWHFSGSASFEKLLDGATLRTTVEAAGGWGPVLVVGLMTIAVVVSPIPSAPIALTAGAAYGHLWGTVYVLLGAELGALIAFGIARLLGYGLVRTWFGSRLDVGLLGSQNILMTTVFLTRLMPFVSFDIVSYAAGLTSLTLWRFGLATFAGIVPASFLLAHFGGEIASADASRIMMAVFALGAVTALPFLIQAVRKKYADRGNRQNLARDCGADGVSDRKSRPE